MDIKDMTPEELWGMACATIINNKYDKESQGPIEEVLALMREAKVARRVCSVIQNENVAEPFWAQTINLARKEALDAMDSARKG